MSARWLPKGLVFRGQRLDRFELDGRVWLVSDQLHQAIGLRPAYLMRASQHRYTAHVTQLARLDFPTYYRGARPRRRLRRLFSIEGAKLLAGAASTEAAQELFELLDAVAHQASRSKSPGGPVSSA